MLLAVGLAKFDRDSSTLDKSGVVETLAKSSYTAGKHGGGFRPEISDHRHPRLLGIRRDRPRYRCTAKQCDELAALHWDHLVGCETNGHVAASSSDRMD